ncbi:hypothetical protein [Bacillus sp. CHD6a]|uniref:hypothetical protein n=1 Tax=Bacillus sp. CHD6a TaxID=1643452 RepID=UPI0006CCF0A4|nr:hypothetical protein [Bacillus sp. CHD6a]KPB06043.1 hypothetical protein AAV98_03760 [Bacillus sp. CHD6a]
MLNKILSMIMILAFIGATITGYVMKDTYSNVTATSTVMDNFTVALWDFDMSPTIIQTMKNDLPHSNLIIRVVSEGETSFSFKNNKQYVKVLEVYKGDEVRVGDEIAVTSLSWQLFFDDMSANLNFVNFMQPQNEYLIFLDRKLDSLDPNEDNIYLLPDLIIPPIFNYQDKSHKIINVPKENRYVPYEEVKENEFLVSSEEALNELTKLKHKLIQQYPQ